MYYLQYNEKLIEYANKVIERDISCFNWVYGLHLSLVSQNRIVEKRALSVMPKSTNPEKVVTLLLAIIKQQRQFIYKAKLNLSTEKNIAPSQIPTSYENTTIDLKLPEKQ